MKHLEENNETYLSHLLFAGIIGLHFLISGSFLIIHGVFPFINAPKRYNLNNTCKLITRWDKYARDRKTR